MNEMRGENKKIQSTSHWSKKKRGKRKKKKGEKGKKSNNNLPWFSSCLRIFQGLQDQDT
jgi:hypothetical protein